MKIATPIIAQTVELWYDPGGVSPASAGMNRSYHPVQVGKPGVPACAGMNRAVGRRNGQEATRGHFQPLCKAARAPRRRVRM